MAFAYKVRDPLGKIHEGSMDATNLEDATQQLRRDGFRVVQIEEASDDLGFLLAKRVTKNDIIYATSQLAIMVQTGITISEALRTMGEQETNPRLRDVLGDLKRSVEGGEELSAALARHPKYFDETYLALIRAGEATGTVAEMLDRIAVYMRKELETRGKIRSAMAYPAVMLVLSIAVTIFLLTYIMPKFEPMFSRPGAKLPKSTVFMMNASELILNHWYFWLAGLVAVVVGFFVGRCTKPGREMLDYCKIHAPLIGPVFKKVAITRSIRTLGTMVASGVSVLDALEMSAEVAGNIYYRRLWLRVRDQVTTGRQICEAMSADPLLPPMLVRMISAGEDTGQLDQVLQRVSSYYDNEVDTAIKTATTMIEPIMITTMGVVVGGIAMSLLLPIFSLSKPAG